MNNEKKKFNPLKSIPLCLCSLMFVASFALFAVSLALSLVDITAGGHISFTASGVYAKVTGTVTGTKTTNTLDTLNFDASTESFSTPDSWKNMTLDFTNDNLITLTINVQNLSEENPLYVKFTDGLTASNVTTTRTLDGSSVNTLQSLEVPVKTTKTAVITLKINNLNKSVSSDFTLNMKLSDEDLSVSDASTYTTLSFTYNDTDLTASVKSKTAWDGGEEGSGELRGTTTGNFVIPSKIKYNGKIYTVTEILQNGFASCFSLSAITIPSTITVINDGAFSECIALKNAFFENIEDWISDNGDISRSELSDPSIAATYLTDTYCEYTWVRNEL